MPKVREGTIAPMLHDMMKTLEDMTPDDYVRLSDLPAEDFWELRYAKIDGHKWLILEDPDPQKTIAVHPRVGMEFTYKERCPDVSGLTGFQDEPVARIIGQLIYPYGSIAMYAIEEQRKIEAQKKKIGSVYFIRAIEGGPIKIGFSRRPEERCKDLQTSHSQSLVIIATITPALQEMEHQIHRQFEADRLSGEWYRASDELLAFIGEVRDA